MEDLLPYYERELAYLRRYSDDFARRYPKIAGRLLPADGHVDDPSIDQSIQAMALLDARIGKKLDDDYPQCIEALFDVLHPHYLLHRENRTTGDTGRRASSVQGMKCRLPRH